MLLYMHYNSEKISEKRFGGTLPNKNKTERAPCVRRQIIALYGSVRLETGSLRTVATTNRFVIFLAASLRNKSPQFATTVCPQVVRNLVSPDL